MELFNTTKWLQEKGPENGTLEQFLNISDRNAMKFYADQFKNTLRMVSGISFDVTVRKTCMDEIAKIDRELAKYGVQDEVKATPLHLV